MAAADLKINEEADEVIGELKGNYPLVAQIFDKEPDMSIEEARTIALLVDSVRWLVNCTHCVFCAWKIDNSRRDRSIKDHGN